MMIIPLIAEIIATIDFCSDIFILKDLIKTWHTGWVWLTLLQMVFSLLVCQVPLIKMLVLRNNLGSKIDKSNYYQKILAIIAATCLIIVQLLMLDIFFMVITVFGGIIQMIIYVISCGNLQFDCYQSFENKVFFWVFNMNKNDVEGFRRARNISQLLFETVPQICLQLRILYWRHYN